MPQYRSTKANFTAGELTTRLEHRYDLAKYANGCRRLRNVAVSPHGTAYGRSGFRFIADFSVTTSYCKLVPFVFSTLDNYMLAFGQSNAEIYRGAGRIESGGFPVLISHPWTDGQLPNIVVTQSADNLYIVHEDVQPRRITRTSHTDWTISTWTWHEAATTGRLNQPHYKFHDQDIRLTPSATTGNITVTADAATPAVFTSNHVGVRFRIKDKEIRITGVTSGTLADATVHETLDDTNPTQDWSEQAFSAARGWPRTVGVHQNRFVIGGSRDLPNRFWMSKTGNWFNFDLGTGADDDAIEIDIGSGGSVDAITGMASFRGALFLLTDASPWIIGSGLSSDNTITPTQIQPSRLDGPGGPLQQLRVVDDSVAYVDTSRRRLIGMRYELQRDGFRPEELTLLAEHITDAGTAAGSNGIREFVWTNDRESVVWAARMDGELIGFTYLPQHDVGGWHQHPVAGQNAFIESVAVIPAQNRGELWIAIKRTINGATQRYIERLDPKFGHMTPQADAFFVDSGITYNGTPKMTMTGLDHLEGETVSVLGSGAYLGEFTVSGGQITLSTDHGTVHAGLGYRQLIEPTGENAGSPAGSAHGVPRRIVEFTCDVLRTHSIQFGEDETELFRLVFATYPKTLDGPPVLVTGSETRKLASGWRRGRLRLTIVNDDPLPMEVRALSMRVAVNG